MNYTTFASESVCSGHPDKICDQVSDAILDAALTADPRSRVGVETLVTKNYAVIAGEVTCLKKLNYAAIARKVIKDLGYTKPEYNFSYRSEIVVKVHHQAGDISIGVDDGGAGDQGMMFGYAVDETAELMPLPITLAHDLTKNIDRLRKTKLKYLRPDGKSEVTVKYDHGKPVGVESVVIAVPHDPKISKDQAKQELYDSLVKPLHVPFEKFILNGTGRWDVGGPASDTGVTGRKIIVDTYGGMARIGGGAFSGKDPTKVDRSAAYAARFIAKNIVAAKLASRCEVQIAYVIGYREPLTKSIETFGTNKVSPEKIAAFAWNLMDLSPAGIIKKFNLRRPIYRATASYGHFGHPNYPWEKIEK